MTGRADEIRARADVSADLSLADCKAWAAKYATTPFNMLALSTALGGDPGPLPVMRALFRLADELVAERDRLTGAMEAWLTEQGFSDLDIDLIIAKITALAVPSEDATGEDRTWRQTHPTYPAPAASGQDGEPT